MVVVCILQFNFRPCRFFVFVHIEKSVRLNFNFLKFWIPFCSPLFLCPVIVQEISFCN